MSKQQCISCGAEAPPHYAETKDGRYCISCFIDQQLKANERLWNMLQNIKPPEIKMPLARGREVLMRLPNDLTAAEAEALACTILSFKKLLDADAPKEPR